MLIHVCIVIVTVICETMAYYDREYSPNVGTVLFSNNDRQKRQWTKTELGLLRARRYFQTILPPPSFMNTFSEIYGDILLEYFKDAYYNIKRQALDFESDSIMTTALSDALGGYFKVWVLPVAKLDYYGGTISQDHIIRLFQFYNEIKSYLDTDGEGWHVPDDNFLNTMPINVAPIYSSSTRSKPDPCDQLAYFEKTPNGLGVPLPDVNWSDKSSTMFVPLKNSSLISLSSPDASNTLAKYYDTAKNCLFVTNPRETETFEEKFQNWLTKNIMPHLRDDHLYLALGSVLSLLNKTRSIYDDKLEPSKSKCRFMSRIIPVEMTSKKMTIIFIILLLEIAWCIPALVYILCSKSKKDCSSNVYLFIDQNKGKFDKRPNSESKLAYFKKLKQTKNVQLDPRPTSFKDLKDTETQRPSTTPGHVSTLTSGDLLCRKAQTFYTEFEAQCPSSHYTTTAGTGSRSYFSSKNQSSDAIRILETYVPKKSALKKTTTHSEQTHTTRDVALSSQEEFRTETKVNICPTNATIDSKKSVPKKGSHGKENTFALPLRWSTLGKDLKNFHLPKRRSQPKESNKQKEKKQEHIPAKPVVQPCKLKVSESEITRTSGSQFTKTTESDPEGEISTPNYSTDLPPICPCTDCIKPEKCSLYKRSVTISEKQGNNKKKQIPTKQAQGKQPSAEKPIEDKIANQNKEFGKSGNRSSIRITDSGKSFFEIIIDKPKTEICVDVSGPAEINSKMQRRSRIPKRNANITQQALVSRAPLVQQAPSPTQGERQKSMIPQLKKKAVDDIALTHCCCKSRTYNKLDETF